MNIRDYAVGSVLTPPSPALSGTSLTLQANEGANMPAVPFYVTAAPPGVFPTLANSEKLNVTARSTDTLTIERAQGETTAKEIAADWVIVNSIFAEDTLGKNNTKWNEPAVGTIDNSNTAFTVNSGQYVAGTLIPVLNGLVQKRGTHYTEDNPGAGAFSMATAPETGDNLQVTYDASEAAHGNADTLGGQSSAFHLNRANHTGATVEEAWTAVTFENGWVDYGPGFNPCQYMKDSMGFVHLTGLVKNGTIGASVFTLPVGYRIFNTEIYAVTTNANAFGTARVFPDGKVIAYTGSNGWFSLAGITFRAEG